jgi:ABC-2 type transport system permease protein
MRSALGVEWLKLRRSRVALVATALMGLLLPAMGLAFYSVAVSGAVGTIADKAGAMLIGEGWVGYMDLVEQIAAVAVFMGAGVVVAWAFGREHVDRTFPALFALTVPRATVAAAKFVVLTLWVVALALIVTVMALLLGMVGGVGPVEVGVVVGETLRLITVTIGAGILALTMGYVASVGRGYLPAIGALAVIIAAAQIAVLFGTGGWFPFAVPGLMAIANAEGAPALNPTQYALVPALAVVTIWATLRWWAKAEVTRS